MTIRLILPTLLIYLCAALCPGSASAASTVEIGALLPDAALRGLNGPSSSLSAFQGQPLLINVWASWCAPCRAEMSSLERLAWRDDSSFINVIGISTDDYPQRARAMLDATNATIAHFIDVDLHLETLLGASRLPLTVLVDENGRVVEKVYGARAWDTAPALQLIGEAFGDFSKVR